MKRGKEKYKNKEKENYEKENKEKKAVEEGKHDMIERKEIKVRKIE